MSKHHLSQLGAFALALAILSCGKETPRYDDQGKSVEGTAESTIDVSSPTFGILNILRANGHRVQVTDDIVRPAFTSKGKTLVVDGGVSIEVYEYGSPADCAAAAAKISPDGSRVGDEEIPWSAPPHLFKTDRVIILYLGSEPDNITELTSAFGAQFAGK